jgi:hypothetical protein
MRQSVPVRVRGSEGLLYDRYSEETRPARRLFIPHVLGHVCVGVTAELP